MAIGNKVIVKILEIVIFVGVIVNLLICINKCDFNTPSVFQFFKKGKRRFEFVISKAGFTR
jgi:hypothetical protein